MRCLAGLGVIALIRKAASELVGTAFLVAAVVGSRIVAARLSPNDVQPGGHPRRARKGLLETRTAVTLLAAQLAGGERAKPRSGLEEP